MSRKFPTHTKLGKVLQESGLSKLELGYASGVSERTLTEYLAGRKAMLNRHLTAISAAFNCDPEELE
jgi:transcriptional regulator with XRE-family HTH domain